ncbi:MAG: hypothetical protein A2Y25_03420 [Candidatus Melainabacteria bacterium GWF2_37_15]|nr:MAG: hypothetical protein A2Y25_03420 [Candidatus Melainabacteria bacterium GWF2_37_15]
MKILLATNYLKGSLSAVQAAQAIKKGFLAVSDKFEIMEIPIADGGDGTLEAIKHYTPYKVMKSIVSGPLGDKVEAEWLVVDGKAVIEAAQVIGLSLLRPEQYNPLKTTTYGLGELIKQAVDYGCNEIILGIGGSATNDAGIGMLEALGYKFPDVKVKVACDVDNPLLGLNGASYTYGPQKGASQEDVKILEKRLSDFADLTQEKTGKDYRNIPGTGAAGGLGFALLAYANAELIPGFNLIAELSGIEEKIKHTDLVITTEGRLDSQTLQGKAPFRVAQMASIYNIPVIVFTGSIERDLKFEYPAFSIADGAISLEDSIKNASWLLENLSKNIARLIINFYGKQIS